MASKGRYSYNISKFDDKNFGLWKEIMKDVLVQRRQIEAIRHAMKPATKLDEEWQSIDKLAWSTMRMHLGTNMYFSIAKEKTMHTL